jgi:hypothetical protein
MDAGFLMNLACPDRFVSNRKITAVNIIQNIFFLKAAMHKTKNLVVILQG